MSLVRADELLKMADQAHTAVIAFICIDYNMVSSAICAAEITGKPAIIMLLPEHVTTYHAADIASFGAMVREMGAASSAKIALHLDHSYEEEEVYFAIQAGYPSVMFDASRDPLEENIRRTRAVVEYAHARGVVVEAELGAIGLAAEGAAEMTDYHTKPETVKAFVEGTGVDSLAISIGNAHGDYPFPPKLDLERLDEINAITDVPLVLHGGSGIPHDQLKEAFSRGINKFNYGTDVLRTYNQAVRSLLAQHTPMTSLDMLEVPAAAQKAMTDFIVKKMELVRL